MTPRSPPLARYLAGAVVAASLLFGSAGDAGADQAHAAERYRAAEEAYAHGAYRAAAETFEAAFREDPRGATIYNAGVSWEAAGDGPRAADDYATALAASDLRGAERADASKRVSALQAKLGRLDATGPTGAKISVAHVEGTALPAQVHLGAGAYSVRVAYADGHVEARDVRIATGSAVSLDLAPTSAPPPRAAPPEPATAPAITPPRPADAGSSSSPLRTAGWVALGGGAALAVAAIALGEATLGARDTFDATGDTSQSAHDRAVSLRTWTNVAWVAAGVVGATGIVLLVIPTGSHAGAQTSAFVGTSGIGIRGRF